MGSTRFGCVASLVLTFIGAGGSLANVCDAPRDETRGPRTLVLALDGVPLRVVQRVQQDGAFRGWSTPRRMIATFPSMTNVSFSAMLAPFGSAPANGYELQHFDWERNEIVTASPFNYKDRVFSWRDYFDVVSRSLGSKLAGYTVPGRHSRRELEQTSEALLADDRELLLVHVGSTDAMQHILGDEEVIAFLHELDSWLLELDQQHRARFGQPLRVVMLSDHGNSKRKIKAVGKVHRELREEGFDPDGHLERDNDVVAATFGIAGFGAVFTDADNAPIVGTAIARTEYVDLAAWPSGEREIRVVSGRKRSARILWRESPEGLELAYFADHGDPLRLQKARAELLSSKLLDADGFAADRDWLRVTELSRYPDALRRLVDAFTGTHVLNHATVMFSARPGRAWGWRSAFFGAWLRGGKLEGTHGGLDEESSLGFWMSSDPRDDPRGPVRAADALLPFLPAWQRVHCNAEEESFTAGAPSAPSAPDLQQP